MLVEAGQFDREQLDRAVAEVGGDLGVFVRSLVGLNRAAVREALSAFLQDATLTANQIEFLDMVVEHLTRHGTLSAAQLYEAPFTEVAPRGPDVIFPQQFADIVVALDEFHDRAAGS
jgi:type I restriction enzyme R subunit